MARRPTIKDVAREAGVSVATVNRVLAGNTQVREETGRKVSQAAHRIGYHGTNLIAQRLRPDLPTVRFGFVLQKEKQSFYQSLKASMPKWWWPSPRRNPPKTCPTRCWKWVPGQM
jgi:LacI family transcriptional regulator